MIRTTVAVGGMACPMCEAHVNDAIRSRFRVRKVTSSHTAGKTVILSEQPLDGQELRRVIGELGYTPGEVSTETAVKKRFALFSKR